MVKIMKLLLCILFLLTGYAKSQDSVDAQFEIVGQVNSKDVHIWVCPLNTHLIDDNQRFLPTYDGKEYDSPQCYDYDDAFTCGGDGSPEISNESQMEEISPDSMLLRQLVNSKYLKIYKCASNDAHYSSYDTVRLSQCIQGKWTPIYDKCVNDCEFPGFCDEVEKFQLEIDETYFLFSSKKLDMYPTKVDCSDNGFRILFNRGSEEINRINTYTYESNKRFIGMLTLEHYFLDSDGNPIPHELQVTIKVSGNTYKKAVYDNFSMAADGTILSIGSYHGDAGNIFCTFVGTKIESESQFWGVNEMFNAFKYTKWSNFYNRKEMSIHAKKLSLIDYSTSCPPVAVDAYWNKLMSVTVPSTREVGTKIEYSCIGEISFDKNDKQEGFIECKEEAGSYVWKEENYMPCKLNCPSGYIESRSGLYCILYSNDTVDNIFTASQMCMSEKGTLLYKEDNLALMDAADDKTYFTGFQFPFISERLSKQKYDNNGLDASSESSLQANETSCATLKKPNILLMDHCFNRDGLAELNFMCRIPKLCPYEYESKQGGCFQFHKTDNSINSIEALRKCTTVHGALPHLSDETRQQVIESFIIQKMTSHSLSEVLIPVATNTRLDTTSGLFTVSDTVKSKFPSDSKNFALKIKNDLSSEIIGIDFESKFNTYVCHYHGYLKCLFESPGEIQYATKIGSFTKEDPVLSYITYKCQHGYFIKDQIPKEKENVQCLGQLGGIYPESVECFRYKVCESKDPIHQSNMVISSDTETYYLSGEIKYTCPAALTTMDNDVDQIFKCKWSSSKNSHAFVSTKNDTVFNPLKCNVCKLDDLSHEGTHVKNPDNAPFTVDNSVTLTCTEPGMNAELGSSDQYIPCGESGWNTAYLRDCYPGCQGEPEMAEESNYIIREDFVDDTVGAIMYYDCDEGYYLLQSEVNKELNIRSSVSCTAEGWKYEHGKASLACTKATTEKPKDPGDKMTYDWNGYLSHYGATITYSCQNENHLIIQGFKKTINVTAGSEGWQPTISDENFLCSAVCLGDPPNLGDNMKASFDLDLPMGRIAGNTYTYTCEGSNMYFSTTQEYTDFETTRVATCSNNGEWILNNENQPLKCEQMQIKDPKTPPEGMSYDWDGYTHTIGTKITYTCDDPSEIIIQNEEKKYELVAEDIDWVNFVIDKYFYCASVCPEILPIVGQNVKEDYTVEIGHDRVAGTILNYECLGNTYFKLTQDFPEPVNKTFATCVKGEGWKLERENAPIECEAITFDDPLPAPLEATSDWNNYQRNLGSTVIYTCDHPEQVFLYNLKNDITVTATTKGWQPSNMTENDFVCDHACLDEPPEPLENMTATSEILNVYGRIEGTKFFYKCDPETYLETKEGYEEILEKTFVQCRQGKWMKEFFSRPLACVKMCSDDIPTPAKENITNDWDGYSRLLETPIIYECPPNHLFLLNNRTTYEIKCDTNTSEWESVQQEFFYCAVACLQPLPNEYGNAKLKTSLENSFSGHEVTYQCDPNTSSRQGSTTLNIYCDEGTWSQPYIDLNWATNVSQIDITEDIVFQCEPSCHSPPPLPTNGSYYNFTGDYTEYQVVHYYCTWSWFEVGVLEFFSFCKNGSWSIEEIPKCVDATTTTKAPETVNPLLDAQFYADTNPIIIIENINQLNSSTDQPLNVTDTPVPFGTGITLNEEAKQCAKWDNFQNAQCVTNPRSCIDVGFSFSIWAKVYEVAEDNVEKRYLISTGGTTDGHPGVAIYVQADWLYSLVSIGEKYWLASAFLHVPNEQWSVIAVTLHNDDKGLITYIYKSDYREMKQLSQQSVPETAESKVGLSPPEIMFGCHKTSDNPEYRDFITADLDSFVVWQTPVVNEKWFTGGYSEENRTIEELVELLNNMEEQIPPDVSDAIVDLAMIMMQEEEKKEAELAETSSTSTEEIVSETSTDEMVDTDNIENLLIIIKQLINLINCPSEPKAESDIGNGVKPLELLSKSMDPSDSNVKKWKEVTNKDSANEFMNIFMQSVDFVHCNAISIQIEEDTFTYSFADKNLYTYVSKNKVDQLNRRDKVVIPSYNTELDDAHTDIARVAVWATRINDGRCENRTFTLTIQSAPTGFALHALIVNKRELNHNERLEIDSPVTGIRAETDPVYDENGVIDTSQPECGYGKLSGYKIDILIPHESKVPEIRSRNLLFFEESVHTEVIKRYCALWNKDIEKVGAWDISKCKIGETSSNHTRCLCAEDGLIVIIAHLKEKVEVPKDPAWLVKTQRALYIASAICIVIYAIVVLLSGDLKDQFHLAGLNLAIAIIMGHAAMYASEYEEIAENREACGWVSTAIYYFYLSVGTWIMALGHCCFKAITAGVISGKLHTYVCMAWGFSLTCLGLVMMFYLHDIGTDPRCFVAWEDEVKLTLLGPQAAFSLIAVFLTFVILCNLSTPALRKDNLIDDYGSFCKGAAFLMFVYGLTWIFAIFAYLRLDIDTDFYPIFTVLNSAMGVFLFLFIGLGSNRFRMVILGQAKTRRNMLKNYAFGLPGRSKPRPLK